MAMAGSNGGSPYGTRANGRISPGHELPQASGFQTYYSMPHHAIVQPQMMNPQMMMLANLCICPKCQNECSETDSVECLVCKHRHHVQCIKMPKQIHNAINGKEEIGWFCSKCRGKKGKLAPNDNEMNKQMAIVMERMTKMMDRMDVMENNLVTKDSLLQFEEKVEKMMDSKIEDALQEKLEKEKRRLNLLFVNIEESNGDREDKMKADIEKVKAVVDKIIPEEDARCVTISNPTRLGPNNLGTKPRLLRVEINSDDLKWKIIKNAHKLNEGKDWSDPTRQYVNLDLTAKERQRNKELRDELKARKLSGEKNIKIKGGEIVTYEA